MKRTVLPHRREGRDVRPSPGTDRGDPEQLGLLKHPHHRRPWRRLRAIITRPGIELSYRTHTRHCPPSSIHLQMDDSDASSYGRRPERMSQ
jgi:hypothetical protein